MFSLDLKSGVPIYEQLERRLTELIASEAIAADEKLPTVREIAKNLGINPNTVQKAYRTLELKGLVYSQPSRGFYASDSRNGADNARLEVVRAFRDKAAEAIRRGVAAQTLHAEIDNLKGESNNA